jgi:D-alanyl-D-alanine carboxypeptidase
MMTAAAPAAPVNEEESSGAARCALQPAAELLPKLQHILDQAPAQGLHAALLHVQCGRSAWSLASGVADLQTGRIAQPTDRFRAGSILKPAIAAVVLQLAEEGKLSLDEPITRRLSSQHTSGFRDAEMITVRMLLNHRSGIGEWTETENLETLVLSDLRKVWTPDEYIALSIARGPKFRPDAGYAYNNTEYVLLGLLIEKATGKSWRDAVIERIFAPIGISAAALPQPGASPNLSEHVHGYMVVNDARLDVTGLDSSMADAAGGHAFAPTTAELAHFMDSLLEGRFFKREQTLAQMMEFNPTRSDPVAAGVRIGYGLGLGKYQLAEGAIGIGHTGSTAGYHSFVFRLPELGVTITGAGSVAGEDTIMAFGAQACRLIIEEARR